MKQPNPYEAIIQKLKDNHIYPSTEVLVKKDKEVINGLRVEAPPILKDERIAHIKKVIGENFIVTWLGNGNDYILIKIK